MAQSLRFQSDRFDLTDGKIRFLTAPRIGKREKAMKRIRPSGRRLDRPELISSMIDVCATDPALTKRVIRNVVERRKAQLAAMEAGATPAP